MRDNGIGMSPDIVEQLFTPFFTTKPPGEGTGLGLSLSYDIVVQQHNGQFTVDTKEPFMKNAMSIVPGIRNIDSMMMLSLDMISVLPGIEDLPSKIEDYGSTDLSAAKNMEVILDIIIGTLGSVGILFIVGIAALVVGRGLLKGKNWVRNVVIVFAIISMVVTVSYMGKVNDLFLLGSFVFDTIVFFYMLRPHVRKYFTQTSIKNSKIKT